MFHGSFSNVFRALHSFLLTVASVEKKVLIANGHLYIEFGLVINDHLDKGKISYSKTDQVHVFFISSLDSLENL